MALGATMNGLIAHGMAGLMPIKARATLGIPTDFDPVSVWALGKHGDKSTLPPKWPNAEIPSGRRPVA
jgi:hypothetical protein